MSDDVTDEDKYLEAKRELGMRIAVYGKAAKANGGIMPPHLARQLRVMAVIADDYLRKIAPGLDLDGLSKASETVPDGFVAPLVLYCKTEAERAEVIEAFKRITPGFRTVKI